MLSSIFKKKFTDEQLANVFVNGIFEGIDKGFDEVKNIIEEDPSFYFKPDMSNATNTHFTMILIVGNIKSLSVYFSTQQQKKIEPLIFKRLAAIFEMDLNRFMYYYNEYSTFMKHVNLPSKVVLYSMSKAMFYKYDLNEYQEEYFRNMNTPNPLFLKRLDDVLKNFIWNWEAFFRRYRIND